MARQGLLPSGALKDAVWQLPSPPALDPQAAGLEEHTCRGAQLEAQQTSCHAGWHEWPREPKLVATKGACKRTDMLPIGHRLGTGRSLGASGLICCCDQPAEPGIGRFEKPQIEAASF